MEKRKKIKAGIICMILAGSIGAVGFVLYSTQNNMDSKVERVEQLEEELAESDTLRNDPIEIVPTSVEAVSTPTETPTPEPTPVETISVAGDEFSDGKCYMDIAGNFTEPGFGRVQIRVSPHDAGAADDYVVNINGSNGAADNSTWTTTANWDAASSSLIYHGVRTDNVNGVTTTYDEITGSLRYDGPDTLYWTDSGTGNYDRGPFERYEREEYSNEYNVYNEPSANPEDHTASYDDGHGFYGTWTGNGFEDTFTGGSFNGKTITISPSNKEGYEYRVVISDPYDNGMMGSSIRAFGNYNEEYGIVYNGGEYDNIDLGVNWPDESNGVLYLDDDNSLYNYDVSTENITGPFKKTSDKWD